MDDFEYAFEVQFQEILELSRIEEEKQEQRRAQQRIEKEKKRKEKEERKKREEQEKLRSDNAMANKLQMDEYSKIILFSEKVEHSNNAEVDRNEEIGYDERLKNMYTTDNSIFNQALKDRTQINISALHYRDRIAILLHSAFPNFGAPTERELMILRVCWFAIRLCGATVFGGVLRDFIIRGDPPNDIDLRLVNELNESIDIFHDCFVSTFPTLELSIANAPTDGHRIGKFQFENEEIHIDFVSSSAFHSGKSVDFDVNNLQINNFHSTHQRVDIGRSNFEIIDNILAKQCFIAHANTQSQSYLNNLISRRIPKMEGKGWKVLNKLDIRLR